MAVSAAAQCNFLSSRSDSATRNSMQNLSRLNQNYFCPVAGTSPAEFASVHSHARALLSGRPGKIRGKFSVRALRSSESQADSHNEDELSDIKGASDGFKDDVEEGKNLQGGRGKQNQKSEMEVELEEVREDIVNFTRSIVGVLNGSWMKEEEFVLPGWNSKLKSFSKAYVRMVSGSAWTANSTGEFGRWFRAVEADFFKRTSQFGHFLVTMMSTGALLAIAFEFSGGNSQMDMVIWSSWLAAVVAGTMIGSNQVLERRCKSWPQNVVITGSTRGLGKALAREFLFAGDNVVIASRSPDSVRTTTAQLQQELTEGIVMSKASTSVSCKREGKVIGIPCDVSNVEDVKMLADFAVREFGSIDIWINNAGMNKGFRPLLQFTDEDISQIVSTNLIGSLICTKEAMQVMKLQEKGGHIFNMDGAGSGGSSTPLYAVYGSTKCGLRQLNASLLKECKKSKIGIHTASPGMVLTDLLLSGASRQNKKMFNIICELPETVARTLVPRMRAVKGTGKAINYLTPPRILLALVTAWLRRGRWFDEKGKALYAAEADRVRNWAENRARFSFSDAMDFYSDGSLVSVFSFSLMFSFIILSSSGNGMSGS